jgi:hypothetical protein
LNFDPTFGKDASDVQAGLAEAAGTNSPSPPCPTHSGVLMVVALTTDRFHPQKREALIN